jgi:uncharacterized membrane protein YfcA
MTKPEKPLNKYARFSGIGLQMGAIILAGAYFGQYLDERFQNSGPYLTAALALVAVFISLYLLIKELKNLE